MKKYEDIKNQKTAGIITFDPRSGVSEIAQPLGPILGLIPVTNPTSTTIFKALISLKTRNSLIVCPHQAAPEIARRAGFEVPPETTLLIAPLKGVGPRYPLSAEILAPILAFYIEDDFDAAIRRCTEITRFGGTGHTAVIYSNLGERVEHFSRVINAGRILVNMPSTQGALGGIYNTLSPSFTLGCGTGGNNITTDNITARHLLNIHRIARRRPNPRWATLDHAQLLNEKTPPEEIESEFNRNY